MLPERLIYLLRIGDALQCRLTFTSGNTVLQFAQVACEICPNRKNNHNSEQEQERYSYARVRIRNRRHFHQPPIAIRPSRDRTARIIDLVLSSGNGKFLEMGLDRANQHTESISPAGAAWRSLNWIPSGMFTPDWSPSNNTDNSNTTVASEIAQTVCVGKRARPFHTDPEFE